MGSGIRLDATQVRGWSSQPSASIRNRSQSRCGDAMSHRWSPYGIRNGPSVLQSMPTSSGYPVRYSLMSCCAVDRAAAVVAMSVCPLSGCCRRSRSSKQPSKLYAVSTGHTALTTDDARCRDSPRPENSAGDQVAAPGNSPAIPTDRPEYADPMSAKGDEGQPRVDVAVSEAFRGIAEHYVETAKEMFKNDPDLCIDTSEPRLSDINPHNGLGPDVTTSAGS